MIGIGILLNGISFVLALGLGLILIPLVRKLCLQRGWVAPPRADRWHSQSTPYLGGIAIFIAFAVSVLITLFISGEITARLEILVIFGLIFLLGLLDDFKNMSPQAKLIGQMLVAILAIALGYSTEFFSPRVANPVLAQFLNTFLTLVWLIGITNAINLLDNMDGLAGGICLITTMILSYFFWQSQDWTLFGISMALAGGILAFLVYNFPPASIFMGDSGSLFLGFSLALLAIARQPQASNVLAVVGVPTLLFLLPILDTALVTFTRLLRGQSPAQGGRDHTSHRLIAFGLSERQAVLVLYGVAVMSGIIAVTLESIEYWFSMVLVPLFVIILALLVAYLGNFKLLPPSTPLVSSKAITRIMLRLTFKLRLLEIILDFFLIALAYYLALLISAGARMNETWLELYFLSLPVALGISYLVFHFMGVYRQVWRYVDMGDLGRFSLTALLCSVSMGIVFFVLHEFYWTNGLQAPLIQIVSLYFVFLLFSLAASRSSFQILDSLHGQRRVREDIRVLILGDGDSREMALHWLLSNQPSGYRPVGFLVGDPNLVGRQLHGLQVLGNFEQLEQILTQMNIQGLILAGFDFTDEWVEKIQQICQSKSCWVKRLKLDLEDI